MLPGRAWNRYLEEILMRIVSLLLFSQGFHWGTLSRLRHLWRRWWNSWSLTTNKSDITCLWLIAGNTIQHGPRLEKIKSFFCSIRPTFRFVYSELYSVSLFFSPHPPTTCHRQLLSLRRVPLNEVFSNQIWNWFYTGVSLRVSQVCSWVES